MKMRSSVSFTLALGSIVTEPNDLNDLIFVEILKIGRGNHLVVVLLRKQKTSFLQPFTVKCICILENLTNTINGDLLRK